MVLFCKPRVCGEKSSGSVCMPGHAGSPPRMRGKVIHSLCDRPQRGITPAYTGKRNCGRQSRCSTSDHPRVCGEKRGLILRITALQGSPPRMRGKGRTTRPAPARARITPACAGKRKSCAAQKTSAWDHPRMCGEKLGVALLALAFKGSPPHVRGKVLYGSLIGCTAQDHPRMCGEKAFLEQKGPP